MPANIKHSWAIFHHIAERTRVAVAPRASSVVAKVRGRLGQCRCELILVCQGVLRVALRATLVPVIPIPQPEHACTCRGCAQGREEAVARIRAAADARAESGSDILIVARSDARQADSLQVGSRWNMFCSHAEASVLAQKDSRSVLAIFAHKQGSSTAGALLRRRLCGGLQHLLMLAPTCCL